MIVVDASAAAKLLLDEADSVPVRDWFRTVAHNVVGPDLIHIEVTQAVVRRVNAGQIAEPLARGILREWTIFLDTGVIGLLPSSIAQIGAAAELAMRLKHPVKDCLYLVLAIELDCDLVTCDAKFRAKAAPQYPHVRLLTELR